MGFRRHEHESLSYPDPPAILPLLLGTAAILDSPPHQLAVGRTDPLQPAPHQVFQSSQTTVEGSGDATGIGHTLLRIYNNIPITTAVRMYRNLLYDLRMPRLIDFVVLGGTAVVVLLAGWWLFDRLEARFAEEL